MPHRLCEHIGPHLLKLFNRKTGLISRLVVKLDHYSILGLHQSTVPKYLE